MSVRAIAIRNAPPAASLTAGGRRVVRRPRRRLRVRAWLADDRRGIGVKMLLVGLLVLMAMALEVPL